MRVVGLVGVLSVSAEAGSGPWVVGEGRGTLYVGTDAQRFNHLATVVNDERDVIEVDEGVSTFGVKGIGTVGLGRRAELELVVPWYLVQANRTDGDLCRALPLAGCRTTSGIGVLRARAKGVLLDEYFGAPLTLSAVVEVRVGDATAATRERVTNLGEGTLDAGPVVAVGRTGALGEGFWSAYLEGGFRYRSPNTDAYPQNRGDTVVPGSEITGGAEVLCGPGTRFGVGPTANLLYRPFGLDFGEIDLTDPDRFGALRILQAAAGVTAFARARQDVTASASVQRTIVAVNNPTDIWVVNLGVQFDGGLPGGGDG